MLRIFRSNENRVDLFATILSTVSIERKRLAKLDETEIGENLIFN